MKEEELIDKALLLLNESKDSNYRIAKNTGMSESTLSNYKRGRTRPTPANATLLVQYFEHTLPGTLSNASMVEGFRFINVVNVPVHARAGYMSGYGDDEYIASLPTIPVIVDKEFKGKYRVFDVDGDSMDDNSRDAICDKDKILCREIQRHLWQYKLHINDWFFVIVHKEEGVIVKQIIDHNVDTCEITCHSLNPLFKDFTINLDDVLELYNVIKIVDRNTRI